MHNQNISRNSRILAQSLLLALGGGTLVAPAHAANWLMLQGTEAPSAAPRAQVWGYRWTAISTIS